MELIMQELYVHFEWILRIVLATFCGAMIGYERSSRNKEAGLRTHAILALGASLIMVVSKYGFLDIGTIAGDRIAAQVVSGIGFLGAGVIFVKHGSITGLTTAAGMWATSGIGLCIGAGLYDIGIVTTILIVGLQFIFHKHFFTKLIYASFNVNIEVTYDSNSLKTIQEIFEKHQVTILDMKVEKMNNETMFLEVEISTFKDFDRNRLLCDMIEKDFIKKFSYM